MVDVEARADYDGFPANWFHRLLAEHEGPFKHKKFVLTAGPWRPYFVDTFSKDGTLFLDFYSAAHAGFGSMSDSERKRLLDLL